MSFLKVVKTLILLLCVIFVIILTNIVFKQHVHIPNVEDFSKIIRDANENIANLVDPADVEIEIIEIIDIDKDKVKRIEIDMATSTVKPPPIEKSKPSVFCIIKTHPDNIKINKTLTVLNVWGHKCDNYR